MNAFLLTLTALLILVLSALFAAPLFIDWNDYRHVFETQATKLLGREVKVGGKVHLVLLPAPELKFDDVKVADEQGRLDRPFLEARSIEAWLNIGALLTGTVEARQIVIVDPTLRLDVKTDGTGNWRDVGRPGETLPFAPKEVMLDSVSVSGGRIEIAKDGVERLILNGVEGQLSAASLAGPYKVSATYDYEDRRQELRFSTSAVDDGGQFRLKAALRDPERNTNYVLDGGVSGLGGKPAYDGNFILRVANAVAAEPSVAPVEPEADANGEELSAAKSGADPLFVDLKGPLKATPERAELSEFDLTIHAKGRPQILKGSLALDLGETIKAEGALAARFIDVDLLVGTDNTEQRPSPATVLYHVAEEALTHAAEIGEGTLAVAIEQVSLGGDLIGGLDLDVAANAGGLTIERLAATLPGDNRVMVSGRLAQGAIGPLFQGPVRLEGTGLRALTRWAGGDRDISGQASVGDFAVQANVTIGDGELKLADAQGEVSDTAFRGGLLYRGGEKRSLIELSLDSDRLDLREMMGEGAAWRSWLPDTGKIETAAIDGQNLLVRFRDHDAKVTLNVGELLLPDIPPGRLDARFTLQNDTLDVERLEFAAADELTLTGKGRIEQVSAAPSGQVDFALRAATTDGLRVASDWFGLSEDVSKSKHLSALAPLDVRGGLVAIRDGEATKASLELSGQAGPSQIALNASATGEPDKLKDAEIDLKGSVSGERPEALLVLLFPDLPQDRIAKAGGQGTLSLQLKGVPRTGVTGNAALKTAAMQLAFAGNGALQDSSLALNGKASVATQDASLVLPMAGLEPPPSAAGVPLTLTTDVMKQGDSLELAPIKASIDGDAVSGSAKFEFGGDKTRFTIDADAGAVSLPALLGVLVAWERSPSSEETLSSLAIDTADVWPQRGFSLGVLEDSEGDIKLKAKTLSLGSPFKVADATLAARIGDEGLAVTELKGRLFGGALTASGQLAPRGTGAAFEAKVALIGGKLEDVSKTLAGKGLAKGPFDLTVAVNGEGLSPPGLVAGMGGEGTLTLGAGVVQSLNPEPLRRVAVTAAKKIKANKEQIEAEARAVREKVTTGLYKYAPTEFAFEIENGTLRFAPATLAGAGAETKVNAFVELASLKLDSEWEMSLTGKNKDVPAVSLVFTGSLSDAGQIAPAIDTAAIESFLTIRRMQEDVEQLETLDVTGRTPAAAEPEPEPEAIHPPVEDARPVPLPDTKPASIARPVAPVVPPELMPMPSDAMDPEQPVPPSESLEDQATPTTAEVPAEAPVVKPRRTKPREAPDDWKKGISIFGG